MDRNDTPNNGEYLENENGNGRNGRFLTFFLNNAVYAVAIRHIKEVTGLREIFPRVGAPPYVKGVILTRGELIPLIDGRRRLALPERGYDDQTCFIVLQAGEFTAALAVDEVLEVLEIPSPGIVRPPDLRNGYRSPFVAGVSEEGGVARIILDVTRLVNGLVLDD